MSYTISGLPHHLFAPLSGLTDEERARRGISHAIVDIKSVFPCRITLEDAEPGERLYLLNFEHQPAKTPYRSSHAIFVGEAARGTATFINQVPDSLHLRLLSIRAFDVEGAMTDADVVNGVYLETIIERFFADPKAAYLHVHYAKRGGYAARVDRSSLAALECRDERGTI